MKEASLIIKFTSFLGVFNHARCVKWLSVEIPITSAFNALNLSIASEKATSSVGQTYVKSNG